MAELRPMQQEVITGAHQRFIHADPPGTGKTPVGWSWLSDWEAERSLIVAPRNVLRHWEALAPTWAPEFDVTVIPVGATAKQRAEGRAAFDAGGDQRALVIPYTTLSLDIDSLVKMGFDSMLCDEAHKLKGRKNTVFKSAQKIAKRALIVDLTTASPILNSADECWSAMNLVDHKRWPSYWSWAREHFNCYLTTFGGRSPRAIEMVGDPRDGALEAIRDDFGELLVMRSEEEMGLDLPDLVETFLIVDLSPTERKIYDQMSKHYWLEHGDTVVFAPNEVTKITRMRQLSSDWSAMLADELVEAGTKVRAVADLIVDQLEGKAVVVFAEYKGTVYSLVDTLRKAGITAAGYTGDLSDDERTAVLEDFASHGTQVLVGTDATMREGLDGLQHTAHHMVIIDPDWVPELEHQKIGRLKRTGQEAPTVFVWYVLANGTVDKYVERTREMKQDMLDVVVGHSIKDVLRGR